MESSSRLADTRMHRRLLHFRYFLADTRRARPLVGISACLCGERVRYDGADKGHPALIARLARSLTLHPLCPEVAAGLGVPRPPVRLVGASPDALRARGVTQTSLDVSDALQRVAGQLLGQAAAPGAHFCGYLFKSKSPSCGLGSTPWWSPDGDMQGVTSGLVAGRFQIERPDLCLADDAALDAAGGAWRFILGCRLAWELRHVGDDALRDWAAHYQRWLPLSAECPDRRALGVDVQRAVNAL